MKLVIVAALALAVSACAKKKDAPQAAADKPAAAAAPAAPPPVETPAGDTTPLWALAPPGATVGMVVADGALRRFAVAVGGTLREVAKQPWAQGLDKSLDEMAKELRLDFTDPAAYKNAGIDLDKGIALFLEGKLGEPVLAVIPVSDREAFRKYAEGTTKTVDGREVDQFKKVMCLPSAGRYLCAEKLELIDAAAKPHLSPLLAAVKALPAADRGDFEIYADLAASPGATPTRDEMRAVLGDVKTAGMGLRLEPTGLTVRAWGKGDLSAPMASALASGPPSAELLARTRGAVTLAWWRGDPQAALGGMPVPSMPLAEGVDARDLAAQYAGEGALLTVGRGTLGGLALLKVKDAAAVTKLVANLCAAAKASKLGVKLYDFAETKGGCQAVVEKEALAMLGLPGVPVGVGVDGTLLGVSMGDAQTSAAWTVADMAGSPATREMLRSPASFLFWSSALDLDLTALPKETAAKLDGIEQVRLLKGGLAWLTSHVYEVGFVVAVQKDIARATLRVTTFGGDPPEARAAYERVLALRNEGGGAPYQAALVELEKKFAGTLAARRAQQARSEVPLLGPPGAFAAGMVALVAMFAGGGGDAPNPFEAITVPGPSDAPATP